MSLDISLCDTDGDDIKSMNWLRNPFGLEQWAQGNFEYITKECVIILPFTLWDVCNQWNYEKSSEVDRPLFKFVVDVYAGVLKQLETGYFWFDIYGANQYIIPKAHSLPFETMYGVSSIKGRVYHKDSMGIPQKYCKNLFDFGSRNAHTLEWYNDWFNQLVEFAELLQNTEYDFYCSN